MSAERSVRQQMASLVDGGFSNERTLDAGGAPPEVPRLSQDSQKIIPYIDSDADRGPFEAQKEDHLRRPA